MTATNSLCLWQCAALLNTYPKSSSSEFCPPVAQLLDCWHNCWIAGTIARLLTQCWIAGTMLAQLLDCWHNAGTTAVLLTQCWIAGTMLDCWHNCWIAGTIVGSLAQCRHNCWISHTIAGLLAQLLDCWAAWVAVFPGYVTVCTVAQGEAVMDVDLPTIL